MARKNKIMTIFLEKLRSHQSPTADDMKEHLLQFHQLHPGITADTFGRCRDSDGKSGYEFLSEVIDDPHSTVVDLACGNGAMIPPCLLRLQSRGQVIAIDMSSEEIAAARRSVGEAHNVQFLCESAQKLSLQSSSVDVVLCHLAFMLMESADQVLAEIDRVLKPGGIFSMVVFPAIGFSTPLFDQFFSIVVEAVMKDFPTFQGWGDKRTKTMEGMRELISAPGMNFSDAIEKKDRVFLLHEGPDALAHGQLRFFYGTWMLSSASQESLHHRLLKLFQQAAKSDGSVAMEFPVSRITVRKKE